MYFQIQKLNDAEKLTVATISSVDVAIEWYRMMDDRDAFKDWKDLNERLIDEFRSSRKGSLMVQFLVVR